MNLIQWSASGVLALSLLAGCNNPKSPDAQVKNVAAAEEVAAREQTEAEQKAVKQVAKAADSVADKTVALDNTAAKAAYDVQVATADGNHKIALEKCEALSGDSLRDCKEQADANYAVAKADAKAAENR
jgi:Tfp pilus assembly major pilin PilA